MAPRTGISRSKGYAGEFPRDLGTGGKAEDLRRYQGFRGHDHRRARPACRVTHGAGIDDHRCGLGRADGRTLGEPWTAADKGARAVLHARAHRESVFLYLAITAGLIGSDRKSNRADIAYLVPDHLCHERI